MSSTSTILLTGGTGHVGFGVLSYALRQGYTVKAVVRSESKAAGIKAVKSIQQYLPKLSFVVIPDLTVPGAFDEALKGCDYIIHVASPIPDIHNLGSNGEFTKVAVAATTNVLNAALKVPSIKRVSITSSTAAISPPYEEFYTADLTADSVGIPPAEPYMNDMFAYTASKVHAHQATLQFIKEKQPHFTVISVMPSYVIGPNELTTTPEKVNDGSNNMILSPILGEQKEFDFMVAVISLDDVARVHVDALTNPKITKHESFLLSHDQHLAFQWDQGIAIAEKAFPDAVKSGILPLGGHTVETPTVKYDSTKALNVFGPFKTIEYMVKDIVGYYVKVVTEAK